MSLSNSLKNKKFDIRMLEWNLKNGIITQQEYDQHIANLSDDTPRSENLKFEDNDHLGDEPPRSEHTNGASSMQGFRH
ncbi:MAG: hypothetical protein R2827_04715 [Bdellovibrionales bacterium]